ncbi:MAG: glycosyl transferase, partial [Acholeplasmataceae bacterium]|nr:glycosyl transferase [Acholeplasmataceae bacterium]
MKIQIPKTIHYIWLGGNEKTELILRCIKSWSETNPDFEIIEWNEMNYDTTKHPQIKRALEAKNYA